MTDLADLKGTALSLQGRGADPREAYFSDRKKELCPNVELPDRDTCWPGQRSFLSLDPSRSNPAARSRGSSVPATKHTISACCVPAVRGGWTVQRTGTSRSSPRWLTQGARPGHGMKGEARGSCTMDNLLPGTSSLQSQKTKRVAGTLVLSH